MQRGFTLIELIIVIAIVGIAAATVLPLISGRQGFSRTTPEFQNGKPAGGLNCVGGFLFSTDSNGNTRQATDAEGKASKC